MQKNDLARALPLIAMVLGNKLGVTVTVQGNAAYTDGKHINIPILPENDKDSLIAVRGFLDHEAAHVRFTDMTVNKPEGFVGFMLNLLEDIRIEHAMSGCYPGSRKNLIDLADLLIRQGLTQLPAPEEASNISPVQVFSSWISLKLQAEKLNYPAVTAAHEEAHELAHAIFPIDLLDKVADIVDPILQLSTAHDTLKMAQEVATYFEDYIEQEKQKQEQQAADSNKENESSKQSGNDSVSDQDSQSADGSDGNKDNESDNDSQLTSGSAAGDDSASDQDSQSADGQQSDSDPEGLQGGDAIANMLDNILNAEDSDFDGQDKGKAISQYLNDKSEALPYSDASIVIPETVSAYHSQAISLDGVLRASSQLRTKLTGLVQASKMKRNHPKQAGRRLDTRFINRIPTSDMRIFTSKQEKRAVNTAVLILIDRSTSMSGTKMEVARESALSAAIGVNSIPGASVCVGSFPAGRTEGVIEVLPFDQNPRHKYRNFGVSPRGGTPMAEAMWWGASKLLARKEPRKLMIVVTDGEANDPAAATAAIERVTKNGIEMMGLGIQHHAVEHLFDEHRVIHSVEEMPAALIGMLQSKLRQGQ